MLRRRTLWEWTILFLTPSKRARQHLVLPLIRRDLQHGRFSSLPSPCRHCDSALYDIEAAGPGFLSWTSCGPILRSLA